MSVSPPVIQVFDMSVQKLCYRHVEADYPLNTVTCVMGYEDTIHQLTKAGFNYN